MAEARIRRQDIIEELQRVQLLYQDVDSLHPHRHEYRWEQKERWLDGIKQSIEFLERLLPKETQTTAKEDESEEQ